MSLVPRRHSLIVAFAVLTLCHLATPPLASAQVLYGSIVGNVQDTSGAAIPGATVTITNRETGLARTAVTNDTGGYTFTNVLTGNYDVKVSLQSFKEFVEEGVPVSPNTVSRVDAELQLGNL